MALTIKYVPGSYGEESITRDGVKTVTVHVLAELYDGTTLLARKLIQGITSEADRDAKAQAAFEGITTPVIAATPAAPSTAGWKTSVAKAAKAEIG